MPRTHLIIDVQTGEQTAVPYTAQEEADADAAKAADDLAQAPVIAAQQRVASFKADATYQTMLAQLKQATPAQVQTYITNNVTDLASARAMLVRFALVLALVANGG